MNTLKKTGIKYALLLCSVVMAGQVSAAKIEGRVLDLNGDPVAGAIVTITPSWPGPTAISTFSSESGEFSFPEQESYRQGSDFRISIRALDFELVDTELSADEENISLAVIARYTPNQVASAPASAWLMEKADHATTSQFIMDCVGCHQVPSSEFRAYAAAIADIPGVDRSEIRRQGYDALQKYMNFLSAEEFSRGPEAGQLDASQVYSVGDGPRVTNFMTEYFPDRMDNVSGYAWGAPLAVTPDTAIMEYEVPRPNAIREALLVGNPKQLWAADVASNTLFRIDPESGYTTSVEVPADTPVGPHSLHRGADGSLWMAPFVTSVVGHLDLETETWSTWPMRKMDGSPTGIHDLSFGSDHTLMRDRQGLIWFSDIGNDAVGYLDTETGDIDNYPAPEIEGREGNGVLYGLVMEDDRDTIWFSQLNISSVGSFNVETREFGPSFQLPVNSGPRRLSISDDGILFVPLYGSGQLVEYDTNTFSQVGVYDLPDTASAPYATTWDPVRRVVWIPTSNTDVIYKFDPADKSISVLPMPRQSAFLRMVDIDPDNGNLITSYANIVEHVHGPRMALIIDPGDGAYE